MMHNDPPVSHIAITCPNCGKHYRKVPYEAIRKYNYAFCKQCSSKFTISPAELEQALQQALSASAEPAAPAQPASLECPPAPRETAGQDAAAPADQAAGSAFGATAESAAGQPEADEATASLNESLEQKITDLAADIEDAFSSPAAGGDGEWETAAAARESLGAAVPPVEPDLEPQRDGDFADDIISVEGPPDMGTAADAQPEISGPELAGEPDIPQDLLSQAAASGLPDYQGGETASGKPLFDGGDAFGFDHDGQELSPVPCADMEIAAGSPAAEDLFADADEPCGAAFSEPLTELVPPSPEAGCPEWSAIEPDLPAEETLSEAPSACAQDVLPPAEPVFVQEQHGEMLPVPDILEAARAASEAMPDDMMEAATIGLLGPAAAQEPETTEELLDEDLIEDETAGETATQPAQEHDAPEEGPAARVLGARGASAAAREMSLFDSLQTPDGRRDVTEMLKQLVTPADQVEEGMEQFVLFTLGEQTYAAPITSVFELSLPPDLIQVPNTPAWVLGVSNMRGEIISVIDFREFLNIEPDSARKPSRMIIAQTLDKQMVIGLMVDGIGGIKYFSADAIQPLEPHEPGVPDSFFRGACLFESEVVIFLDLEFILQSQKMRQFQ